MVTNPTAFLDSGLALKQNSPVTNRRSETNVGHDEDGELTKLETIEKADIYYKKEMVKLDVKLPLADPIHVERVKGVITQVDAVVITLKCKLSNDHERLIEIPTALVPHNLSHFGAPVWISVDTDGGIRRISITEREEIDPIAPPEDADVIDAWINKQD